MAWPPFYSLRYNKFGLGTYVHFFIVPAWKTGLQLWLKKSLHVSSLKTEFLKRECAKWENLELWSLFLLTTEEFMWQKTMWMKLLMENTALFSDFLTLNLYSAKDLSSYRLFPPNIIFWIFKLSPFELLNNLLAESYRLLYPVASTDCGYGFPQTTLFNKYIVHFQICSESVVLLRWAQIFLCLTEICFFLP